MEVPGGHDSKVWVLLYELMGTALLLLAINNSAAGGETVPYSAAIGLFGIIMLIGPVSGGHVNPAVSTAVFVREGKFSNIIYFFLIIAAQLLGAGCGVALLLGYASKLDDNDPSKTPRIALLCPHDSNCDPDGRQTMNAFVAEMFGTFIFTSVILSVKYNNGATELAFNAFVIAITLYNVIQQTKNISGAAINPAVGVVQTIFQMNASTSWDLKMTMKAMWIYIAGPITGGALAGLFSHFNTYNQAKLKEVGDTMQNTYVADESHEEAIMDQRGPE